MTSEIFCRSCSRTCASAASGARASCWRTRPGARGTPTPPYCSTQRSRREGTSWRRLMLPSSWIMVSCSSFKIDINPTDSQIVCKVPPIGSKIVNLKIKLTVTRPYKLYQNTMIAQISVSNNKASHKKFIHLSSQCLPNCILPSYPYTLNPETRILIENLFNTRRLPSNRSILDSNINENPEFEVNIYVKKFSWFQ